MDAKKCDRCGKYYDYYQDQHCNNGFSLVCISKSGNVSRNTTHDLCSECLIKLKKFLKGEENGQL